MAPRSASYSLILFSVTPDLHTFDIFKVDMSTRANHIYTKYFWAIAPFRANESLLVAK